MSRLRLAVLAALLIAAGDATAQTRSYGQSAGWTAIAEHEGGRFLGCGATRDGNRGFMGLAHGRRGDWILVLGMPGVRGAREAHLAVDGRALPARPARGDGSVVEVMLSDSDLAQLAAGTTLRVEIADLAAAAWAIGGAGPAMDLLRRCVAGQGRN
jgi:invasion protein IalB